MPQVMRGYDIRVERAGGPGWMNERIHAWAPAGSLPSEWTAILTDSTVVQACCFLSTEARKQSQKRKILASYDYQAVAC